MRKCNYASRVKKTLPQHYRQVGRISADMGAYTAYSTNTTIDIPYLEAYLYLRTIEGAHGDGKTAGTEERGAGARRRAQSQSRSGSRRLGHRQSILRHEGPDPGALRDGAAPPGRRRCNQRGRRVVRRHAADLLQGSERATDRWARRFAAEPARSQRRPQDLCRGHCLRDRPQSCKPRANDVAMSRCDRGTLRRQGAPAQSGAGAGAQKKTNQSNLIIAPPDVTDVYEKLRAAVLSAKPTANPGLGIIRRRGLAAWIRAL